MSFPKRTCAQLGLQLAVLWACVAYSLCQQVCQVSLDIDAPSSTWNVSASVSVAQLPTAMDVEIATGAIGMQGRMFLNRTGSCIASLPELISSNAFGTAQLVAPSPFSTTPNVRMWPKVIVGNLATVGTLQLTSLELDLTSQPLNIGLTQQTTSSTLFQGNVDGLNLTMTGGVVVSNAASMQLMNQLPHATAVSSALLTVSMVNGTQLTFTFSNMAAQFDLSTQAQGLNASIAIKLAGTIVARTALGCADCGQNGVCTAVKGKPPACKCDCGWAGNTTGCATPSGFCSVPLSYMLSGLSATTATPASQPAVSSDSPLCPDPNSSYNPLSGDCSQCNPGFRGPSCQYCAPDGGDAACRLMRPSKSGVTCDSSLSYQAATEAKTYLCDTSQSNAADTLDPSFAVSCNTTRVDDLPPISIAPDGSGPTVDMGQLTRSQSKNSGGFCRVTISQKGKPDAPMHCLTWGCRFEIGSADVKCRYSQCITPNGGLFESYAAKVNGEVDLKCQDGGEHHCLIAINEVPFVLDIPCSASECVDPNFRGTVSNSDIFSVEATTPWDVIIAGIPLYVIGGVALLLALLTLPGLLVLSRALSHVRSKSVRADGGALGSIIPMEAGHRPVFVFRSITVSQPEKRGVLGLLRRRRPPALWNDPHAVAEAAESHSPPTKPHLTAIAETREQSTAELAQPVAVAHSGALEPLSAVPSGFSGISVPSFAPARNDHTSAFSNTSGFSSMLDSRDAGEGGSPYCGGGFTNELRLVTVDQERSCERAGFRPIVSNLSGSVAAGEILAVMGPSGSGKSTLLAVLSQQYALLPRGVSVAGHVALKGAFNSEPLSPPHRADAVRLSFLQQDDSLLPTLTVSETVLISLMLREPDAARDLAATADRVLSLLSELGLTQVAHRAVGGAVGIRGISGGERRRVSIGVELITRPQIIIMDEPTSGLDSYNAHQLLRTLKRTASLHGRIVIASLHQPSPGIFAMLDHVVLLALGHAFFSGPSSALEAALREAGLQCPAGVPLAEHLLELVSVPDRLARIAATRSTYAFVADTEGLDDTTRDTSSSGQKGPYRGLTQSLPSISRRGGDSSLSKLRWDLGPMGGSRGGRVPALRQLGVLAWRGTLDIYRNPTLLVATNAAAVLVGLLCGLVFWRLEHDISGAQNRAGCFFFCTVLMGLFAVVSCDSLSAERGVVAKEVGLGWYSPVMYALSRAVLDAVLLRALPAFLFGTPLYFMAGFQSSADRYFLFVLVLCAYTVCMGLVSMIIVQWTGRLGTAMLAFVFFLMMSLLFSGFLVNTDSINSAVQWLAYLSVVKYTFEPLVVNEFQGTIYSFSVAGYSNYSGIKGEVFASSIGLKVDHLTEYLWVLFGWFAGLTIVLILSTIVRFRRL